MSGFTWNKTSIQIEAIAALFSIENLNVVTICNIKRQQFCIAAGNLLPLPLDFGCGVYEETESMTLFHLHVPYLSMSVKVLMYLI